MFKALSMTLFIRDFVGIDKLLIKDKTYELYVVNYLEYQI